MDVRENAELVARSHVNKFMKSDEFKSRSLSNPLAFYATGFNDSLLKAREFLAVPLSTLHAIEYDSNGDEV